MWGDMVILFCVWTLILIFSSIIILIFLRRETQKFHQRIVKGVARHEIVTKIHELDSIMARYVNHLLNQGSFYKPVSSLSHQEEDDTEISIKAEAFKWFQAKILDLQNQDYSEHVIKTSILSAIKTGLTSHPLDLRGSRRALEAAKIFLHPQVQVELESDKASFLENSVSLQSTSSEDRFSCPTTACDIVALKFLQVLEICVTSPNTASLLFVIFSFLIWFYDTITDLVVINIYWNLELSTGIEYPSYQTLTVDLYAPLLLLILIMSIMLTVFSGSCSDLVQCYLTAKNLSEPEEELKKKKDQDPTKLISRYNFNIFQASSASLLQFCLQFSSYILIIHMLEALKDKTEEEFIKNKIQEKLDLVCLSSLWFSGFGSFVSLVVAQYNGFKIQHEHCMTLAQRIVYVLSCIFNTISIMAALLTFMTAFILPITMYVGRYHIMIIVIFVAVIISIGFLVSFILNFFGMDLEAFDSDRLIAKFNTNSLVTSLVNCTQTGEKSFASFLGASSLFGKILSLITVNFYLPPSQLLVHPFCKFFTTSPRSPALHYTIAKHLISYNILMIVSSIFLCGNISQYELYATNNLLIFANICGIPCLFISYLLLFRYYSSYDLWTSNGVHLVFYQKGCSMEYGEDQTELENGDQTQVTFIQNTSNPFLEDIAEESFGPLKMDDANHEELSDEDIENEANVEESVDDCDVSEESQDSRDESSRHIESQENIEDTNPFLDTMGQPITQEGNIADENVVNPFLEEIVDEKATSVIDVNVENAENPAAQVADVTDANVENSENPAVQVVDVHDVEVENVENINKEDWVVVEESAYMTSEIKVADNNIDDNKTLEDPNPNQLKEDGGSSKTLGDPNPLKEDSGDESSGQPLTENLHNEEAENDQNIENMENESKETSPLLVQSENNEDTIEVKKDEESLEEPIKVDVQKEETKVDLMKTKSKQILISVKSIGESTKQNIQVATKKINEKSSAATKHLNEQRIASTQKFNEQRIASTKKFKEQRKESTKKLNVQRKESTKKLNEKRLAANKMFNKKILKSRTMDCAVQLEEYSMVGRWVDVSE